MPKLNWDGNDFRNSQDSSGTVADNISRSGNLQQGYNHGSLTKGLVAYYPMEKGEGEVLHDGAFSNLGQINGPAWGSNSKIGNNALDFNGSSDYVQTEIVPKDINKGVTISYWAKWPSNSSTMREFGIADSNDHRIAAGKDQNAGGFDWFTYDGSTVYGLNNKSVALSNNTWHHMTLLFDGSSYKIFVDGAKQAETSSSTFITPNEHKIPIGAKNNNGTIDTFSNATIDDFRVYDRALSQPEIEALANYSQSSGVERTKSSVPGQSEGGISRYKLDGDATDAWGENHGTNNGADLTTTGVYGTAAKFTGSETITSPVAVDGGNSFSVALWLKTDVLDTNYRIAAIGQNGTTQSPWSVRKTDTNNFEFNSTDTNPISFSMGSGEWYQIVATYDNKTDEMKLYSNGSLSASQVSSITTADSTGTSIGGWEGESIQHWDGKIDDVRIYDKALSPLQVEKLYHKGAYRISRESTLQ